MTVERYLIASDGKGGRCWWQQCGCVLIAQADCSADGKDAEDRRCSHRSNCGHRPALRLRAVSVSDTLQVAAACARHVLRPQTAGQVVIELSATSVSLC